MNEITLDSLHQTLKEFNPNFVLIGDLKNIDKDIDKNGDSQASVNNVILWESFNIDKDETVSFDANPSYKNLIVSFGDNPSQHDLTNSENNISTDAVYAGITDKVIIGVEDVASTYDDYEVVSSGDNPASNSELVGFKLTDIAGKDVINENSANAQGCGFTISVVTNDNADNYNTAIKTLHVPYYNNIELIGSYGTGTVTTMEGGTQTLVDA